VKRRAAWWWCLGVVGGVLGLAPAASARPVTEIEPGPVQPLEQAPADPEEVPAPEVPQPEPQPEPEPEPEQAEPTEEEPATLEDPAWDEGEDHPAQLEHDEEAQAYQGPVGDDERLAPEPEPVEPVTEEPPSARQIEPFLFEVGGIGGLLFHRLTYRDDLYGFMRPYSLANAKEVGGYVSLFPLARADMGLLGGLGVELRYTHMFAFDSLRSDGSTFPTRSRELVAGFRYRIEHTALTRRGIDANVGFGGGGHTYDIGSAVALPNVDNRASVPSRHYRFLRVDAATRIALDMGFFLSMHIGVRMITSAGDVDRDEWFPRGRRWGLESGLHLGYVLPKDLELSLGFEAQRYMYRLNPEPGDANIVGGLLDRYVHAQVRAGWRF